MSRWTCPACDREFGRANHAEAVRVGVFLKSDRKIAEVPPKACSLSLALNLPRPVADPRISRKLRAPGGRTVCFVKLVSVEDVDDRVREWLTEAYLAATDL